MDDEQKKKNLLELLAQDEWPRVYLFKFIVTNTPDKVFQVKALQSEEAEITLRDSKNGKYTSISIKEMMMSPEEVLERYAAVSKIEGVMSL